MIEAGLIVARFLHYVAVTTLAGASLFPLYACGVVESGAPSRWRQGTLLTAAIIALLSGLVWFVFSVANMSGTLTDVTDPEVVWSVLHDTGFGTVWAVRMTLTVVALGLILLHFASPPRKARGGLAVPALAGALLISLAGVGHTQVQDGFAGLVHVVSDAAHLLAAGAWLGGLVALALILVAYNRDRGAKGDLDRILMRFSGMGYVAVATLVGSGLVNSWYLVGTVTSLLTTQYGQLLLAKLALFAGMLLLAVINRFWLVPSTSKSAAEGGGSPVWTVRLRNHVLGEQFLGLMILVIVSVLGTMAPAIGQ